MHFSFSHAKVKKILLAALIVGVLILGTSTVMRAAFFKVSRTDFTVYLRAATAIQNHEYLYGVENERHWHYVYLPLFAILLTPFTSWPLGLTAGLWFLLSLACLYGCWRELLGFFKDKVWAPYLLGISFLIALPPLLNTFTRGQLGVLGLYLTLLPFMLDLRGKKFWAGFVLGFGIILKMSPILIMPFYFLIKRNWRALMGCISAGLIFGVILPATVLGPQTFMTYTRDYLHIISASAGDLGWKTYLWEELFTPFAGDNQSFYAVMTRLYWKTQDPFFAGASNHIIRTINLGFMGLLLGLVTCLFFIKTASKEPMTKLPQTNRDFTVYALLSSIMLFTSPVSQVHHFTPIILLATSLMLFLEDQREFFVRFGLILGVCVTFFACGMLSDTLAVWGLPLWGTLLLWIAVLIAGFKNRRIPLLQH